ncbi:LTA synthase family protein [Haploplasma modicum]|uniref:LTA synthase family protein n=1 Tax=Haploplasma modicum TaxID=2150 RepID=UPI00047D1C92|nr:alkaline phosphatase family protein [Haploplasma modicum]
MKKEVKIKYSTFVILFLVLNILITYVVTTEFLNKYITTFEYTWIGVVNSIIGNLSFLLIILFFIHLFARNIKTRIISLIVASFVLSGSLFWVNTFNRYYGTAFTISVFSIFKNPAAGFGLTIFFESMREMITYYRIILFIPFIVLLIVFLVNRKKINGFSSLKPINFVKSILSVSVLFLINIVLFSSSLKGTTILESAKSAYATQNMGIYNFIFLDAVGFDFAAKEDIDQNDIIIELDKFNKNKDEYINILDNKKYKKEVLKKDVSDFSGKLVNNLTDNDSITGILEDYNLVLVHLESFNYFLLENPILRDKLPNLVALLDESYVFSNFYTTVGLGNSFDAEVSVLTGLYANGINTIGWEFDKDVAVKNYNFQSIPKLFNDKNYSTISYHGNDEIFYNRNNVHPNMFGFDEYKAKETLIKDFGKTLEELQNEYNHKSGYWLSDRITLDYLNNEIDNNLLNDEKFMKFLITMLPHTPYHYDPYHEDMKDSDMYDLEFIKELDSLSVKYFNYLKYYNESFKLFFEDVNAYGDDYIEDTNNLYNRKKTAYVFYGDHGSGLQQKDVNYLYDNELENLEIKQKLLQTLAFIYVPGEEVITKDIDGKSISFKEGLLKGNQPLLRDQVDLYRTIIDLFGLELDDKDYLFGTHGMSNEPSFALDNKSLNIITDGFITNFKNDKHLIYDINYTDLDIERIKKLIVNFKRASDYSLNNNLFQNFKNRI